MSLLTELEKSMQRQSINITLLTERMSDARSWRSTNRLSNAAWDLLLDQRYRILRLIIIVGRGQTLR
jgi:hypothetical protein